MLFPEFRTVIGSDISLGVDIHLDTPTEILHTVLLGVVKYFWGQTVYLLVKAKKMDIFQVRLESVSSDGLNIPHIMAAYMCQYKGSLIGKHFKSIVQILPMVIYDMVSKDLLDVWLILGHLVVLCWHTEITDTQRYLVSSLFFLIFSSIFYFNPQTELQNTIDDLLTKTALCAPSILISKPKFHFLKHLPFYIQRFGPALLFATERYESFNTPFRLSCIYSNRLAPSRDSARIFANLDRVKHIASGGWWYNPQEQKWESASTRVVNLVRSQKEYAQLLGMSQPSKRAPGISHFLF